MSKDDLQDQLKGLFSSSVPEPDEGFQAARTPAAEQASAEGLGEEPKEEPGEEQLVPRRMPFPDAEPSPETAPLAPMAGSVEPVLNM